jgi:hypothetical protein
MDYRDVVQALDGNEDEFLSQFEKAARGLIAEGADVIVWACQFFGRFFDVLGYSGKIGRA